MAINIDTTSPTYQQYLTGITNLRNLLAPRIAVLIKLPRAKQKQWLQKDPLLRKVLKMSLNLAELAEQSREETAND